MHKIGARPRGQGPYFLLGDWGGVEDVAPAGGGGFDGYLVVSCSAVEGRWIVGFGR